jgi:hypothetical protein
MEIGTGVYWRRGTPQEKIDGELALDRLIQLALYAMDNHSSVRGTSAATLDGA